MQISDFRIRDPFILLDGDNYYMYASNGHGFMVYVSDNLTGWSEPTVVFTPPEGFWADRDFWAPEVHKYKGAYYLFASLKSPDACRGTQIFRAESPLGPFELHSDGPVTPRDWECLDGTLHIESDGTPYMVFCHEWVQVKDGEMCAMPLTGDLSAPAGEPILLFKASQPAWALKEKPTFVTDGPFLYRTESGRLMMIWSSFAADGYCEALAYSDNGSITGKWSHDQRLLFTKDGGHGMIFRDKGGALQFVCHQPNGGTLERAHLTELCEKDDTLWVRVVDMSVG
ncbi:MAG: family 43 glycosylhydrolase [Clostridia bacterium]|nr:family 43 glycosylhydrolase [Clostridia bacterium]